MPRSVGRCNGDKVAASLRDPIAVRSFAPKAPEGLSPHAVIMIVTEFDELADN